MCGRTARVSAAGPKKCSVHQVAQLRVGGLLGGADQGPAGVVHQHVDAPEPTASRRRRRRGCGRIGDVELDGDGAGAVGGDQVVEPVDAAGSGDDVSPAARAASAIARPKPLDAPVISHTRWAEPLMMSVESMCLLSRCDVPCVQDRDRFTRSTLFMIPGRGAAPAALSRDDRRDRQPGCAAGRLHVSQPALSYALSSSRAELGVQLFERHPGGVIATAAGRDVVAEAKRVLRQADRIVAVADRHRQGQTGVLRVGFEASGAGELTTGRVRSSLGATPACASSRSASTGARRPTRCATVGSTSPSCGCPHRSTGSRPRSCTVKPASWAWPSTIASPTADRSRCWRSTTTRSCGPSGPRVNGSTGGR